jgi:hypothetical protein
MKQQAIKLLAIATPILLAGSLCSPARADFGMMAAQNAINMQNTILTNSTNKIMNDRAVSDYRKKYIDSDSTSSTGNSGKKQRDNSSKAATGTTFSSDPAISKQVKDSFLSKVDTPIEKKFLTFFLTPKNAKKIFGIIDTNDMVDVFSVASLYSFSLIEDKSGKSINKEQMRSTRQRFRKMFAEHSIGNATMQRSSEALMYWTMLIAFSQLKAENNANTEAMDNVKTSAGSVMKGIGLSPQKYTLSDRGFVLK